ncbi:MAG TPA: PQQ-binding-like beta-propeller repeat protein [Acetobacteraceae bacterium]|nr:PQQ-binding-like beta-propeller repeat protein [Acetobacteraceae bacterium]
MRIMRAAFALLPLLWLAVFTPHASATGLAFVMNSDSASISVIDMATHKELRRIPVLREPHHWALTPDGKSLLVGDTVGNELFSLDPATGALQRTIPCVDPYQLWFSPNGKFLVVNGLARNQVDVYNGATFKLVKRFHASAMPSHLAYSPDSSIVFVSLQESNRLMAIDLNDMKILWDKPVGNTPAGVLWLNGKVLVADMGADYLAEVDPADGKVLRHIITGKGAHNLFLSPDGKTLWVNNRVAGTTETLHADSLTPIHTYRITGGPDDLAFAPDGKVWITRRWAETVAVLDPATGDFQTIDVGRSPHGIFLNDAARPYSQMSLRGVPAANNSPRAIASSLRSSQ